MHKEEEITFDDINYKFRFASVFCAFATLVHLIGIASNHWAVSKTDFYGTIEYSGLWEKCNDLNIGGLDPKYECRGFVWEDVQVSHWFRTIQTMQAMSFVGMLVVLILCCLYMFVQYTRQEKVIKLFAVVLCFLSGLFAICTCIVFGSLKGVMKARNMPESYVTLSWSFAFALLGGILQIIAGVLVAIGK